MALVNLNSGIGVIDEKTNLENLEKNIQLTLPNIDLSDLSPIHHLNIAVNAMEYNNSLAVQNQILQSDIRTATGIYLDKIVSARGCVRILAQNASAICVCYGTDGTLIPSGTQIKTQDGTLFSAIDAEIITKAKAQQIIFEVGTVTIGQIYSINLGGYIIQYTAIAGDTQNSIITNLIAAIQNISILNNNINAIIENNKLKISSKDPNTEYSFDIISNMSIYEVGSLINFTCLSTGAIAVYANTINKIDTSVIGFKTVNNIADGTSGTIDETDDNLRNRYLQEGIYGLSVGTPLGIQNALLKIKSVIYCKVYNNRKDYVVDNMLPHSVKCVIEGGSDTDIINVLRGAIGSSGISGGIETNGATEILYTDIYDVQHSYFIQRPTNVYVWLAITIPAQPQTDYAFNNTIETQANIKQLVSDYGNQAFNIGDDIITNLLKGVISLNYKGLVNYSITMATTISPNATPLYANVDFINIDKESKPRFATNRITIL